MSRDQKKTHPRFYVTNNQNDYDPSEELDEFSISSPGTSQRDGLSELPVLYEGGHFNGQSQTSEGGLSDAKRNETPRKIKIERGNDGETIIWDTTNRSHHDLSRFMLTEMEWDQGYGSGDSSPESFPDGYTSYEGDRARWANFHREDDLGDEPLFDAELRFLHQGEFARQLVGRLCEPKSGDNGRLQRGYSLPTDVKNYGQIPLSSKPKRENSLFAKPHFDHYIEPSTGKLVPIKPRGPSSSIKKDPSQIELERGVFQKLT